MESDEGGESRLKSWISDTNWEDVDRVSALYSPFRSRDLNPVGFDAKLAFWEKALNARCANRNSSIFDIESIKEDFRIHNRSPSCLEFVISELRQQGKVLPAWDDGSWSSWAKKWTVNKLFSPHGSERAIYLPALNTLASQIKEKVSKYPEVMFNKSCYTRIQSLFPDRDDVNLCIQRLVNKGELQLLHKDLNSVFVKYTSHSFYNNNLNLDSEKSVLSLFLASESLKELIKQLEERKQDSVDRTKGFLRDSQRERAKGQLARTRRLGTLLSKNEASLDKVESLLDQVLMTGTQKDVVNCLEGGSKLLKKELLDLDYVDDVMDQVRESLEASEDVSKALSSVEKEDDEDLLNELAKLEEEEIREKDSLSETDLADALNKLKIGKEDISVKEKRLDFPRKETEMLPFS